MSSSIFFFTVSEKWFSLIRKLLDDKSHHTALADAPNNAKEILRSTHRIACQNYYSMKPLIPHTHSQADKCFRIEACSQSNNKKQKDSNNATAEHGCECDSTKWEILISHWAVSRQNFALCSLSHTAINEMEGKKQRLGMISMSRWVEFNSIWKAKLPFNSRVFSNQ